MTAAVDRVESRGMVVRKATAEDRRVRRIELTPVGRRLIEGAFRKHSKHLEEAMAVLDEPSKKQLYDGLKKLGLSVSAQIGHRANRSNAQIGSRTIRKKL
jgi:MarR family 2-MHQ and catechol resistance regulon transcriptional repressor